MNVQLVPPPAGTVVRQVKEVPGVMTCVLTHNIEKNGTKGAFEFKKKISPEVWQQVLAFFKWSYDTTKSETQVRLYVHAEHGWKAWAFPQKANLGMSAKELEEHERFGPQRLQFGSTQGWQYFGTVHHHCAMSAFQSGTDRNNEVGIDGLHITVGNLDKEVYDLHARFSLSGHMFDKINLSWFWEVGDYASQVPELPKWAKIVMPSAGDMAILQMSQPAPADTVIPEEWKENIITPPPAPAIQRTEYMGGLGYNGGHSPASVEFRRPYIDRSQPVTDYDLRKSLRLLNAYNDTLAKDLKFDNDEIINRLVRIENMMDDYDMEIMDILARSDTLPRDFAIFLQAREEQNKKPAEAETGNGKAKLPETNDEVCGECGLRFPYHGLRCSRAGLEEDQVFQS